MLFRSERKERDRSDISGQFSRIYQFQDDKGNLYLASCDFPFGPDWHDLTVCYTSVGWSLADSPRVCSAQGTHEPPWKHIEASFIKPDGSTAELFYCAFDEHGQFVEPPSHSFLNDIWRSLQKQYRHTQRERFFQVQVWTTSTGRIGNDQIVRARELLLHMREPLRSFIIQNSGTKQVAGGS